MSINIDINNKSNYPTLSSSHYKKLEISKKLEELDVISFFAIDIRTNLLIIEFKHGHQPKTKKVIGPIDLNNWTKFSDKVVKELVSPPIEIDRRKAMLIKGNLDQEYDNIFDILLANKNKNNTNHSLSGISDIYDNVVYDNNSKNNKNSLDWRQNQQQQNNNNNNSVTDQSDQPDETKNSYDNKQSKNNNQELTIHPEEQHQNDMPFLGVLQAIRTLVEGPGKVIGRIVGRSTNFKVISRSEWKCQNFECQNSGLLNFYPSIRDMPKHLDTSTGTNPYCWVCKTFGSLNVISEYQIAKKIQLEDIDTIEERFDRLNVIMYGDSSDKIIDGEIVEIEGNLITQKIVAGINSSNGSNKMVNVLVSDKPIIYKNRKEIKITQKDIDNFYRWKKICIDVYKKELAVINKYRYLKKEERPNWVNKIKPMTFEQRVTALFAPNVYGHSDAKMGILRSLIGGSRKENEADTGRRGRIHTNLIGDPGTAKTALSIESTKLDQNSRMVDASGASGKSLVGIVDKENDGLMVKYGVVVSAKNSHVVINEASELSHDDQGRLIGIAEEGKTTLDKWGEHIPIDAPTTLIFTTNPLGTKWESPTMSKDKMVVIRQNLLDRIDQTYGFFDSQTEEELEGFTEEVEKIINRKPHNYNFLIKYLQYIKTIEPEFVGTTIYRLNRFWINAKLKGVASTRILIFYKANCRSTSKIKSFRGN